jgi:pimeloyl-ACP methyl ester carboxylesterase
LCGSRYREALTALFDAIEGDRLPAETRVLVDAYVTSSRLDVVAGFYSPYLVQTDEELDGAKAALLRQIRAPYLLVLGSEPAPANVEWIRSHLNNVQIETWPGYGHWLHLVDPRRFAEMLCAFLQPRQANAE